MLQITIDRCIWTIGMDLYQLKKDSSQGLWQRTADISKVVSQVRSSHDTAPSINGTFLNPDTYLNHRSPADGRQYEISRNVVFGVCLWFDSLGLVVKFTYTGNRMGHSCLSSG